MSDHLTLAAVDTDGALREALDDVAGESRASFLKKAVFAGGGLAVGGIVLGGLPKLVTAAASPAQDVKILNFALLLEYLESSFYTDAVAKGALTGETAKFAGVVKAHELAHVAFLKKALGSKAGKKPTFDFQGTTEDMAKFQATAVALEDTGVGAYNGQGANLTKKTLAAAAQIVSVEARHAAWIRDIIRKTPAPTAFDPLLTKQKVTQIVTSTHFIKA